jgi:hypothetical protein
MWWQWRYCTVQYCNGRDPTVEYTRVIFLGISPNTPRSGRHLIWTVTLAPGTVGSRTVGAGNDGQNLRRRRCCCYGLEASGHHCPLAFGLWLCPLTLPFASIDLLPAPPPAPVSCCAVLFFSFRSQFLLFPGVRLLLVPGGIIGCPQPQPQQSRHCLLSLPPLSLPAVSLTIPQILPRRPAGASSRRQSPPSSMPQEEPVPVPSSPLSLLTLPWPVRPSKKATPGRPQR